MFKISSDIDNSLMQVEVSEGLWSEERLTQFRTAVLAEADKFKVANVSFDILADLSKFPVQTQDIALNGQSTLLDVRDKGLRRSAIVVDNVIAKMQIARLAGQDDHRFFASREKAIAWLRSE